MADPFLAEIIMFGGNFAPRGWAFCDGQLLPISQYSALFSLIGTIYGGDRRTTFALPDMRGRSPMHAGHSPGLTLRRLGEKGGRETVSLTVSEIPSHNHTAGRSMSVRASSQAGNSTTPVNNSFASGLNEYVNAEPNVPMGAGIVTGSTDHTGGGQSHDNMHPFLVVNFIIALQGVFPSRS